MLQKIGDSLPDWITQQNAYRQEREERELQAKMEQDHARRMAAEPKTEEERQRAELARIGVSAVDNVIRRVMNDVRKAEQKRQLLEIPEVYKAHSRLLLQIANKVLAYQHREFVIDDNNRDVLRFLLLYFNNCPLPYISLKMTVALVFCK